jgi:hypothetical protein
MEVIKVMHNGGNSLGPAASIYKEYNFLSPNFVDAYFQHCPREANIAADYLARKAEGPMSTVWHEDPPDYLFHVLANELTIITKEKISQIAFHKKSHIFQN